MSSCLMLYSGYASLGFHKVVKNVSLFWACDKNIAGKFILSPM